CQQGVSFPLTF
nr:immunoglobulin light chain junction region [Macaca mulatta]MOV86544.1 immunoglobulin light chain junction region [Macaca mulatta]